MNFAVNIKGSSRALAEDPFMILLRIIFSQSVCVCNAVGNTMLKSYVYSVTQRKILCLYTIQY